MMIQFGFITLFVAAFPLAPLCALFNNLIELRSDANKFVTQFRRPMAAPANSIGTWFNILYLVSRVAVLTNAFIIAFTSTFIPRLVYKSLYSPNHSLEGFVNNSLSYFNVSDFPPGSAPVSPDVIKEKYRNTTVCRYLDYRHPPWSDDKYTYTTQFWHVVAAQFIFVISYENIILLLTSLIDYIIPDVSHHVSDTVRRQNCLTNEIILRTELQRAKGDRTDHLNSDDMDELRQQVESYAGLFCRHQDLNTHEKQQFTSIL
jgi:hypothetical protein